MLKINDKVIQIDRPEFGIGVVLGITHDPEALYSVDFPFLRCTRRRHQLKLYKEMKEERNITLTLEKAKELYKKGGELREIALQAFNEKELNPLPRCWEEVCINYSIKNGECWVGATDCSCNQNTRIFKNWTPSEQSAEAHLAMMQLEQLRDCYNNSCNDTNRIAIINNNGNIELYVDPPFNCFLTFKNHLLAREFFSNFKEIIEIAKELI